jgi:hypothetical protein
LGDGVVKELPGDVLLDLAGGACCPWCREDAGDATVRLEDLADAFLHRQLEHPDRDRDGLPDVDALVADCPNCAKPFIVALQFPEKGGRRVRFVAVRTDADIRHLAERGK